MSERVVTDAYVRTFWEDTSRYAADLLRENQRLRARALHLETEGERLREDMLEMEQHNTNLANLYAASYRLHSTLVRTEVLAGIEEIVVNLIGSEELAIVEIDGRTGQPKLALAFGIEAVTFDELPDVWHSRVEECFETGRTWIRDGADWDAPVTACVPLLVDEYLMGAVVVGRLLQQKLGIEPIDQELFNLLATHAATALYCATLHGARHEAGVTV